MRALALTLILLLIGCAPKSNREFSERIEKVVPIPVHVPGETVILGMTLDSLKSRLAIPGDTIVKQSRRGTSQIKVYKDAQGNAIVECESKDQVIEALVKHIKESSERTTSVPSWSVIGSVNLTFLVLAFILLLIIILRNGKK